MIIRTSAETERHCRTFVVEKGAGQRLDQYLAAQLADEGITRSRVQGLIKEGKVTVNGEGAKPKYPVQDGDHLRIIIPEAVPSQLIPEAVSFEVLYEDNDIVVLAKPPGTVVHPACGHDRSTLVHGLLFHCKSLSGISGEMRPGIVHRLDKDTSGVMVVAKNDLAHNNLMQQFKNRTVEKIYRAIVLGQLPHATGRINLPIGRHPVKRKKMTIREDGRDAATNWRVLEHFVKAAFSYIELRLETGRTHQIRVHLAAVGHPVAGDRIYGGMNRACKDYHIDRQFLHSYSLAFRHPVSGAELKLMAPLCSDMQYSLDLLRENEKL